MMWYDEENGEFKLLEDAVLDTTKNEINYVTKHFNKYFILDKNKWKNFLKNIPGYR